MTCTEIKLERCPCCGGEARAQFEVYGTWVRVFCVACGLSTMSEPTRNFDPTPAAELWSARPIEDALANHIIKLEAEIAKLRTAQGYDASGEKAEAMVKLLKTTIDIPKRYEDLWFEREWLVNKLAFAEKCIAELEAENAKLRAKLDAGETVDQLGKPDWVGKEVRK